MLSPAGENMESTKQAQREPSFNIPMAQESGRLS